MKASAVAAVAVVALAGCNVHFPDEFRIEDLRILELRAEPPEVAVFKTAPGADPLALDPSHLPQPDLRTVKLTALVAHPDLDASFSYQWVRCGPGFRSVPCEGAERTELAPERRRVGEFSPIGTLFAELAGSRASLGALTATLAEDPRDLLNGLYAHVNLAVGVSTAAVTVDTPNLEATKRLVIFDPRLIAFTIQQARQKGAAQAQQLAALGLPSLCTEATDAQLESIFSFLRSRTPNQAPIYKAIQVGLIDLSESGSDRTTTHAATLGEVVELAPGESVTLRALLPEGTEESYQMIDANCELEKFTERYGVSWFTNLGDLSRQVTTKEQVETTYHAPKADRLPDDRTRVRVWSVLRDGRGGSDSKILDLLIKKR